MRASTITNVNLAISREIASEYDNVKLVADNIDSVITVANTDISQLSLDIAELMDFTDITVVGVANNVSPTWDSETKTLYIPDGDKGDKGDTGLTGSDGLSAYQQWVDAGNFGTVSTFLEAIRGPRGATGYGVSHIKYISSFNVITGLNVGHIDQGLQGYIDVFTMYADVAETIPLGTYKVSNAIIGALDDYAVKVAYESNADTNAFTDAALSKVNNLPADTITELSDIVSDIDDIGIEVSANTLARHTHSNKVNLDTIDQNLSTTSDVVFPSVKLVGGAGTEGTMSWNPDDMTMDLALVNGVTLQVGQEANRLVKNGSAVTIPNGRVVMYTGSVGNSGRLTVQLSSGLFDGAKTVYGVATQDILAGENGYVTVDGKIRAIDTTGATEGETWVDGTVLYVKPNDSGKLTNVVPLATQLKMSVAKVIKAHSSGTLEVRIGSVINENQTAPRATVLDTPRAIQLSGAVTGTANFDGSAAINIVTTNTADPIITLTGDVTGTGTMTNLGNVSFATTIAANSVALGTDTTGNYVAGNTAGTGIVVSGTAGEGWSPIITLSNVGIVGTYRSVTTDAQGRVTAGTNPTTVSGYGLTDVYTKTEVDTNIGTLAEFNSVINF